MRKHYSKRLLENIRRIVKVRSIWNLPSVKWEKNLILCKMSKNNSLARRGEKIRWAGCVRFGSTCEKPGDKVTPEKDGRVETRRTSSRSGTMSKTLNLELKHPCFFFDRDDLHQIISCICFVKLEIQARIRGYSAPVNSFLVVVYYESWKWEIKTKTMYGCRCDERLKTCVEESTRLLHLKNPYHGTCSFFFR